MGLTCGLAYDYCQWAIAGLEGFTLAALDAELRGRGRARQCGEGSD